jgi:LysM repeat protein
MANETIGIKLADGTFYPILTEGVPAKKYLDLTTASDNQTTIQVNLYRSKTASMDDAVYVDTLVIDNLVPHGKNEPDITLSLGLDENNQLTAEVKDPESGAHIEKKAVLQTLGEDIAGPTDSDFTVSEAEPFAEEKTEEQPLPIIEENIEEPSSDELNFDDLKFDDDLIDEHASDFAEQSVSENSGFVSDSDPFTIPAEPQEELATDDSLFSDINFDTEAPLENNALIEDFPATAEENAPSEETIQAEGNSETASDFNADNDTFSDIDFSEETTVSEQASSDFETDNSFNEKMALQPQEEPAKADDETVLSDDDFSFDDTLKAAESIETETALSEEEFPDFDDIDISDKSGFISDTSENNDEKVESLFDFDDNYDDTIPTPSISFNDLYDQESIDGVTEEEEEEAVRKTTVPVTICVICAIICIAVLCLLLFFKPVKVFLTGKNSKDTDETITKVIESENNAITESVQETKQTVIEEIEEIAEEAKPEEIVVVETPVVAPVVPQSAPAKPKVVKHHIRWGDTLWDIAGTYYKNPWLYKKIARANGIKNPDLIISGTDITIPEK